jgi:hypothetical protein
MRGAMPTTVEEFRKQVPLTTYADYLPELAGKREDVLPAKPAYWIRTSGKSGEYDVIIKWVPMSESFVREYERVCAGFALFSLANRRGDVSRVKEHLKILYTTGTLEYVSGFSALLAQQALGYDLLPSNGEELSFQERIKAGFEEALYQGIDGFGGVPSVLVAVGEQIKHQSGGTNIRPLLGHPKALFRVMRGLVRSKLAHRPMLPKDLWSIKGIVGSGADSAIFDKRIEELWGRRPLEMYGGTESGVYALQTWDYEGMTFIPSLNFFEFIPEKEYFKWQFDNSYQPKTVLLDEVKPGENYEVVITNLHGGVLTRYRPGDLIKITSLRNEKLNIDIPQMVFERRADELIDIAGFGRLTEKIIWEAIENAGIPYTDWTARKEVLGDRAVLHIYLEPKDNYIASEQGVAAAIYEQFKKLDTKYHYNIYGSVFGDTESVLALKPIEVTLLPQNAFAKYTSQKQAEGADLGHLKPSHINPSDKILSLLAAPKVAVEAAPAEAERVLAR